MKKLFLCISMFLIISGIIYCNENRYNLIIKYYDGRTIYFDRESLKHKYNEDEGEDYYYVWIKTEYSQKAIQDLIKTREEKNLPVNGYQNIKYTLEKRVYKSFYLLCILEKIDYARDGNVLADIKYSTEKWVDISQDDFEMIICGSIEGFSTKGDK